MELFIMKKLIKSLKLKDFEDLYQGDTINDLKTDFLLIGPESK